MRRLALPLALVLACLPGRVQADEPPQPPVVVAQDECEALIDGLLSDNAVAREVAEAGLAKADEALLRRLVARLLRRLVAEPPTITLAEPQDDRPSFALPEPLPAPREEPLDPNAPMIAIQVRLVDATPEAAARLLATGKAAADGATVFEAKRLAADIEALTLAGQATPLTAPQITTLAGQRANVSVLQQIAYVQDFEVESGSNIADPVIATLQEGLILDLRAKTTADGLLVDTTLTLSDVVQPIPEFKTSLSSGGAEVTIQMPEVRVQKTQRKLAVTGGVPVLLATLDSPDKGPGRRLLAFLEASLLPAPK